MAKVKPEPSRRPEKPVCPCCEAEIPAGQRFVGAVTICPSSARTLVRDGAGYRFAKAEDVLPLSETERNALRAMRPAAFKAEQTARLAAIRGRKGR